MATTQNTMVKVFEKNLGLIIGSTITASSGSGEDDVFDNDRSSFWISSGSDDTTDETLLIIFDQTITFDRLIIGKTNAKALKVEYGSTPSAFTNVYSNDGAALAGADWNYTAETRDGHEGYFFEFDSVTTDRILITIKKTNTADEEKKIYNVFLGSEIGTFTQDVTSSPNSFDPISSAKNQIELKKSNGGSYSVDRSDKYQAEMQLFELYNTDDQDIYYSMIDNREITFYPCGGSTNYTQRGWRVNDWYVCNVFGDESAKFAHGRDKSTGIIAGMVLKEI